MLPPRLLVLTTLLRFRLRGEEHYADFRSTHHGDEQTQHTLGMDGSF
jgi:hypothetical protein